MKESIILLAIAVLFILLSSFTRRAGVRKQTLETAVALINRISHVDSEINYYVSFVVDGKTVSGKSVTYPPSTKRLRVGDRVTIAYYYTKAGWPRVIIQDEEMKPCEDSLKMLPKILLWIGFAFFAVAAFCVVNTLIKM